jgi:hypothetical protein
MQTWTQTWTQAAFFSCVQVRSGTADKGAWAHTAEHGDHCWAKSNNRREDQQQPTERAPLDAAIAEVSFPLAA